MEDLKILELYFERNEQAIQETEAKYGKLCRGIAYNILNNREDAEECVNDTYAGVWNAIPPARPNNFTAFVCRIARNQSLKRLEFMKREKRSQAVLVSLDELEAILPDERYAPGISDQDMESGSAIFSAAKRKRYGTFSFANIISSMPSAILRSAIPSPRAR